MVVWVIKNVKSDIFFYFYLSWGLLNERTSFLMFFTSLKRTARRFWTHMVVIQYITANNWKSTIELTQFSWMPPAWHTTYGWSRATCCARPSAHIDFGMSGLETHATVNNSLSATHHHHRGLLCFAHAIPHNNCILFQIIIIDIGCNRRRWPHNHSLQRRSIGC